MSVKIIFVRNGELRGNPRIRHYDGPEAGLTGLGKRQAKAAGEELREYASENDIDFIYRSPWQGALETCKIALKDSRINSYIRCDERLRERDFSGLAGAKIDRDYQDIWSYSSPISEKLGIETLQELMARTEEFLEDIKEWHPGGTVLVFSHGGLGMMMRALCEEEWPRKGRLYMIPPLKNGSILELCYK